MFFVTQYVTFFIPNFIYFQQYSIIMGTILTSKIKEDNKIVFEIMVDYDEALQLKGNINNVHLFSEDVPSTETRLAQRGKNEATYYFLVPKELRKDIEMKGKVRCQKNALVTRF